MITIQLFYNSRYLEELFLDLLDVSGSKHLMKREIGDTLTKQTKRRFGQILAFSDFNSFISAHIDNTESLKGDMKGYYSMTVSKNYRIIISPNTDDLSAENLKQVKIFKVIGVMDYHGSGNKKNKWIIS